MLALKAVLDTNVVVSAHLKADGRQALILELALAGRFKLVVSPQVLEEYEGVLRRPRFGLNPQRITKSMEAIREVAILVKPRQELDVTVDPDDNKILECALEAGADYVVTGNIRHFPARFRGTMIVSPRQFFTVLAAHLE